MKKRMIFLSIILTALLGACGSGMDYAGDTNVSGDKPEGQEKVPQEEGTESETESQPEPKLEIVQSTGGAWKDSIDTVWVHSAAIFENTGDVPVEIGETQMNFKDAEGGILGTASMIYSVPGIVGPGEQAFIGESKILDGVSDPKEYAETTYNFSFDITEDDPNLLEVSGVKGIPAKDEYDIPYKVTGVVNNTTEELQDDIRLAAALLSEDGALLGVLTGSVTVGVNPGSEAGFELSYPEVPRNIVDQIATVEVKAYGWTW
jgi:hypothetical protein